MKRGRDCRMYPSVSRSPKKQEIQSLCYLLTAWRGDEVLGRALMKGFIYALTSQEELPDTVIMYNRGARLPVEGSESLEDLKLLESQGVEILTCGTCLNHYGLTEKLSVGSVTNMYVICEKMLQAEKVVKP